MPTRKLRAVAIALSLLAGAWLTSAGRSSAQPRPPAATPPSSDAKKEQARAHFERGVILSERQAWDGALAEFLLSRELYPTWSATQNLAISLRRLARYDEALDMYERLLREFPNLPAAEKVTATRALTELRSNVGSIDVQVGEPAATVVVDGQDRGTTPMSFPIRVAAGSHVVRVYKEGFTPLERRLAVAGGQTRVVESRLVPLAQQGLLRVVQQGGTAADVLVDDVVVGKTPWEGPLSPGTHVVFLRGAGSFGSPPVSAVVRRDERATLRLALETLNSELRVEPVPSNASVAIDRVVVGQGLWRGRLRDGPHRVEIASEGFFAKTRDVTLSGGQRHSLVITLERDPNAALWRAEARSRVVFGLNLGVALPIFGGDAIGRCGSSCTHLMPSGGLGMFHGGYQWSSGVGINVDVGYLRVKEGVRGRDATLSEWPNGARSTSGVVDDDVRLSGVTLGASGTYELRTRWLWSFRLGGGVLLGTADDRRSGQFSPGFRVGPYEESADARYAYVTPEVRFGTKLGEHLDFTFGVQALVLFSLAQPKWTDQADVVTPRIGLARFGESTTLGSTLLVVSPGVGLRYRL